jgi:hypothetical protein
MRGIETDLFTKLEQALFMTIEVLCEIYTTK